MKKETVAGTATKNRTTAQSVYDRARQIPRGSVSTYGAIAGALRIPRKARWVGLVLSKNTDPLVPCHRVIEASGRLGGYNGNLGEKTTLLLNEGVVVRNDKIDLGKYGFFNF